MAYIGFSTICGFSIHWGSWNKHRVDEGGECMLFFRLEGLWSSCLTFAHSALTPVWPFHIPQLKAVKMKNPPHANSFFHFLKFPSRICPLVCHFPVPAGHYFLSCLLVCLFVWLVLLFCSF